MKKFVSFQAQSCAPIAIFVQAMNGGEGNAFVRTEMRLSSNSKTWQVGVRYPKRSLDPSEVFGARILWEHV